MAKIRPDHAFDRGTAAFGSPASFPRAGDDSHETTTGAEAFPAASTHETSNLCPADGFSQSTFHGPGDHIHFIESF